MRDLSKVSLKVSKYKCFGDDPTGFDAIRQINLIIGRNNSGKSALLDVVDFAANLKSLNLDASRHNGSAGGALYFSDLVPDEQLQRIFSPNTGGAPFGMNHWEYGKRWLGQRMTWLSRGDALEFVSINPSFETKDTGHLTNVAKGMANPFEGYRFIRMAAERDMVPEADSGQQDPARSVQANGVGATNLVQRFLNKHSLPSELVEEKLLSELNRIVEPSAPFSRILVQQNANEVWEVFFEQPGKSRVALSNTGSGFKTVLLVLVNLILLPHLFKKPLDESYLWGFEELENNLHPAMQRRLLLYIREKATATGCRFFLTTHSNVAIDLFAHDSEAQIIHVVHDGKSANAKQAITYIDHRGVLDDLDVRASDLLQSNCVVWVEGPSDRLYLNAWIGLASGGQLREGAHYQCVFYGGKLLSHLSAEPESDDAVQILRVNRNAILVADSDRKSEQAEINATKKRLVKEVEGIGGLAWVTEGREVENYIHPRLLQERYRAAKAPLGRYEAIPDWIENIEVGLGQKFERGKVEFAAKICNDLGEDDLPCLDLRERLTEICRAIRKWNGIPEPTMAAATTG